MRICPGKYVFVTVPKSGTIAVFSVLDKHFGPHIKTWMHEVIVPSEYSGLFRFTTRRNPYARAISQWWTMVGITDPKYRKDRRQQTPIPYGGSFEEFVAWMVAGKRKMRPGAQSQSYRHRIIQAETYLRCENLEEDFNKLPFVTEHIAVPVENRWGSTPHESPTNVFTERTAQMVYDWDRETFDRFEYDPESWRQYAKQE